MTKFKAKNDNPSTRFQAAYRRRYQKRSFFGKPTGVVNYLFAERNMFGRIDQNLDVVVPKSEFITRYSNRENPLGFSAMNFVIDSYVAMSKVFERGLNGRNVVENQPYLSKLKVYNSYVNPEQEYRKYLDELVKEFNDLFLLKKNVMNFNDYLKEFFLFAEEISSFNPISYTAWHRSRLSSIYYSGLALDLSGQDVGDDELKERFINNVNFDFFLHACNNFGFSVSKNAPWVIVADLSSPASTLYHEKYNLSSVKQIFSVQFEKTSMLDLNYIMRKLFSEYNMMVENNRYKKVFSICSKNKLLKHNQYRESITLEKFNILYNNKFIEYYNNIRYIEEGKLFKISDRDNFTRNAKKLEKTFDRTRAIGYINEQYRSVYKQQPGGLNNILDKLEVKRGGKKRSRGEQTTSVPSGGTSGGSGGSSGY